MTTIFAHLPTGTLYADTCQTVSFRNKVLYQQQALKITHVKGEIVALFGALSTSEKIIDFLQRGEISCQIGKKQRYCKNNAGGVVLIRRGYAIVLTIGENKKLHSNIYIGGWIAVGSGSDTKLFRQAMHKHSKATKKLLAQVEVVNKVLRYNSLFDKYSNDKVTYAQEGQLVLNSIGWDWQSLKVNHE